QNQRVDAEFSGLIYSSGPLCPAVGLGVGIDGAKYPPAPGVGIVDALAGAFVSEVEPGELPRIGSVLEAEVDSIGAFIHRPLECRQVAGGADKLHVALLAVRINPTMLVDYTDASFDAGHGECNMPFTHIVQQSIQAA